jgi:hypothetical protein
MLITAAVGHALFLAVFLAAALSRRVGTLETALLRAPSQKQKWSATNRVKISSVGMDRGPVREGAPDK